MKQLRYLSVILALLFMAACARNPVTGEKELTLISEEQEIAIGKSNYFLLQQSQGGDYTAHKEIDSYVSAVGKKLAAVSDRPHLPYEFVVLNNSIPNAWALPGGKIAIYRGLLLELENEAELAAVLSHEIVHSAARHTAQSMERSLLMGAGLMGLSQILQGHKYENVALGTAAVGAGLASLKYSRNAELESDKYGIKYMVKAGYDPQAAVTLQEKFLKLSEEKNPSWLAGLFSTHPPSQERIEANKQTVALYPPGGFLGTKEYQRHMAKLKDAEPAYKNLDDGYRALLQRNYTLAMRLADEGIEIEPNEPHLYNLKGKAAVELNAEETALDAFERAIELNDDYFDFYLQKGLLEKKQNNIVAARIDLDNSVALFPSDEGYYALGELAMQARNFPAAVSHFRIAACANTETGWKARKRLQQMNVPFQP